VPPVQIRVVGVGFAERRALGGFTSMGDDILGRGWAEWRWWWWLAERARRGGGVIVSPVQNQAVGRGFAERCGGGVTLMGEDPME
jgi:hypothetical protein